MGEGESRGGEGGGEGVISQEKYNKELITFQ